jgi:hypothetical protein
MADEKGSGATSEGTVIDLERVRRRRAIEAFAAANGFELSGNFDDRRFFVVDPLDLGRGDTAAYFEAWVEVWVPDSFAAGMRKEGK